MARYQSKRIVASIVREMERNAKQHTRELERRRKELARQEKEHARWTKEQEKQRALDLARQEVEEFENQIDVLLSLHRESPVQINWSKLASQLQPAEPLRMAVSARQSWRRECVKNLAITTPAPPVLEPPAANTPDKAAYSSEIDSWQRDVQLAAALLEGKEEAYIEALNEFSTLHEISGYGSDLDLSLHSPGRFVISMTLCDQTVIPDETKSLRSSGKMSVKKTPRKIQNELYQDHICSCMLRAAREAFAVLPISELLLHALAPVSDPASEQRPVQTVYSVLLSREGIKALDFEHLDPSEAIESFLHNGDFKASRKLGAFQVVEQLTFSAEAPATEFLTIEQLREKVSAEMKRLFRMIPDEANKSTNEDDE